MKIEIGDMVQLKKGIPYIEMIGMIGEVIVTDEFEDYVGIIIDGFKGHSLGGRVTENNGFWVNKKNVKVYKTNNKINY